MFYRTICNIDFPQSKSNAIANFTKMLSFNERSRATWKNYSHLILTNTILTFLSVLIQIFIHIYIHIYIYIYKYMYMHYMYNNLIYMLYIYIYYILYILHIYIYIIVNIAIKKEKVEGSKPKANYLTSF